MLTAMVLVCSLMTRDDCVQFTDNRGPYKTEEECLVRVEEMVASITPTLPRVPVQFMWKCEELKKGSSV
jgi:hypothetical protein